MDDKFITCGRFDVEKFTQYLKDNPHPLTKEDALKRLVAAKIISHTFTGEPVYSGEPPHNLKENINE